MCVTLRRAVRIQMILYKVKIIWSCNFIVFKLYDHITYLLTAWSRVLLGKLIGFQLVKKFPAYYGTRRFIVAFKSAHHLSVSWPESISPGPRLTVWMFRNKINFYGEELLAPHPTPKLEDHPLSAVCDCLFNMFVATLHVGGRSSIRNMRMHCALVTGTHLSCTIILL